MGVFIPRQEKTRLFIENFFYTVYRTMMYLYMLLWVCNVQFIPASEDPGSWGSLKKYRKNDISVLKLWLQLAHFDIHVITAYRVNVTVMVQMVIIGVKIELKTQWK